MTVEIAIELWRSMKEYIPTKERYLAAHQFVNTMVDFDFSDNDIHSLEEVDQYMENAVQEIMGQDSEDDDFDEDDYPDYEGDD